MYNGAYLEALRRFIIEDFYSYLQKIFIDKG